MAAQAIWSGRLRLAGKNIDVKLFSAVQEQGVHFHLLNKKGLSRVRQRMVNPTTGEVVETADIRRAAEVAKGVFVVLDEKDLGTIDVESTRNIEIERFVPRGALDHRYYDRPYWLGPANGDTGNFFALAQALEKTNREGIVHWSMRKRDYVGALRVERGYPVLITLRHAEEVLPLSDLQAPAGRALEERELKLGRQLIAALSGKFDPQQFKEEYRERVLELIAAKRKGKRLPVHKYRPHRVDDASLAAVLERSLRKAA